MPLIVRNGDLFEHAKKDCVIAHGCNAQGKMGKGFAKLIRQKFPLAYMCYMLDYKEGNLEPGVVDFVNCEEGIVIANCVTQKYYGNNGLAYAEIDAIEKCLKQVAAHCIQLNKVLHLPLIGGGLGGCDKNDLIAIFEKCLEDVQANLWLKD